MSHGGCSTSYNLSTEYLGSSYEVLTWPPGSQGDGKASFSIVASASAWTSVRVRFPPASDGCDIEFGAVRLDCGQTLDFTLLSAETATFTSTTTDLSGTLVDATPPVAVYASNSHVTVGSGNISDSTSEQLFPLSAWGSEFVVAPIPDNSQSGYSIRLSCGSAVNVSVDVAGVIRDLTAQRPLTVDFPDNRPAYVSVVDGGGTPIQLVQYVRGATVTTDSGAPAALVIPAVQRFTDVYHFMTGFADMQYVSVVARQSDISGLRLNGYTLGVSRLIWSTVDTRPDWVVGAFMLPSAGSYTLEHTAQQPFGAYQYGYHRGRCAFAHPAGASLPIQVIHSFNSNNNNNNNNRIIEFLRRHTVTTSQHNSSILFAICNVDLLTTFVLKGFAANLLTITR